uniref:Uncharacterized protein n=1 Tax=Helianthus annuus TaxID=4232 RepID=A0A251T9U1_HELAN
MFRHYSKISLQSNKTCFHYSRKKSNLTLLQQSKKQKCCLSKFNNISNLNATHIHNFLNMVQPPAPDVTITSEIEAVLTLSRSRRRLSTCRYGSDGQRRKKAAERRRTVTTE